MTHNVTHRTTIHGHALPRLHSEWKRIRLDLPWQLCHCRTVFHTTTRMSIQIPLVSAADPRSRRLGAGLAGTWLPGHLPGTNCTLDATTTMRQSWRLSVKSEYTVGSRGAGGVTHCFMNRLGRLILPLTNRVKLRLYRSNAV